MKYAISNIALPAYAHLDDLPRLAEAGYRGIEIAPSRIWHDTWHGLKQADVTAYRNAIETAGLNVVGLHSLVFDHPELQLFGDTESVAATFEFMVHLSGLCRDLGGRTLIWGGGRKRGAISPDDAFARAVDFMATLCARTHDHGTIFCFEPLGPSDSDFVNGVGDARAIVDAIDRRNLRLQIDAKALVENDEAESQTFADAADMLVHFHANEPGLDVLGRTGRIDHAALGAMLANIGYTGYVSAEQRMLSEIDYMNDARESFDQLSRHYHA